MMTSATDIPAQADPARFGSCHCGAMSVEFLSAKPFASRACGCSFCRKHQARVISDPEGRAIIRYDPGRKPLAYRFGMKTAEFLICSSCGVFLAAVTDVDGQLYAVLNLNTFDDAGAATAAAPMDYEDENPAERAQRRQRSWTPTSLLVAEAP